MFSGMLEFSKLLREVRLKVSNTVCVLERPRACSCLVSSMSYAWESNASTCRQTRLLPTQ